MEKAVKTGAEIKMSRTETGVPQNKILYLIPVQNKIDATKKGQEKVDYNIANSGIL